MGGQIAKQEETFTKQSQTRNTSQAISSTNVRFQRDWPSQQLRETVKNQGADHKQLSAKSSRASSNKVGGRQSNHQHQQLSPKTFSPTGLNKEFYQVGKVGQQDLYTNYRKGKNHLPQMTKRVLSSQKVVLCKSPILSDAGMNVNLLLDEKMDSTKSQTETPKASSNKAFAQQENAFSAGQKHSDLDMSPRGAQRKETAMTVIGEGQTGFQKISALDAFVRNTERSTMKDKYLQRTSFNKAPLHVLKSVEYRNQKTAQRKARRSSETTCQEITQTYDTIAQNHHTTQTSGKTPQLEPKVILKKQGKLPGQSRRTELLPTTSMAKQVFMQQKNMKRTQHPMSNKQLSRVNPNQRSTSTLTKMDSIGVDTLQRKQTIHDEMAHILQMTERRQPRESRPIEFSPSRNPSVKKQRKVNEISMSQQFTLQPTVQTQDRILFTPPLQKENMEPVVETQAQKVEYQEYSLPQQAVLLIMMYNFDEYPKYLRISAPWHCFVNDALDDYSNQIENTFIQKYGQFMNFLRSTNTASPLEFCGKRGLRLDRVFQCEILELPLLIDKTFRIAYTFEYEPQKSKVKARGSPKAGLKYSTEHRFDIVKKGMKRITWLHISDEMPPCSQNEIQVAPGDLIEFSVTLYNMNGLVDLATFTWEDPELLKIPPLERDPLTYDRDVKLLQRKNDRKTKVHCNINRICEVEDAVPEWQKLGTLIRDQPRLPIDLSPYEKRFQVLGVFFNELDQHFNKLVLQTVKRGTVEDEVFGSSLTVQVKGEQEPILNEIKKRGVIFDRNKDRERIQLRVGDIIVLYNSIKIPEDMQPEIALPLSQYTSRVSQLTGGTSQSQYTSLKSPLKANR